MKKILFACDGVHFSEGAFEFIRRMNEMEQVLVAGVFLSNAEYSSLLHYANGLSGPLFVPVVEQSDSEGLTNSIRHFEERCQQNGLEYRIHRDHFDFALSELKAETRFADLLVLGIESFYENLKGSPNPYLIDTLHGAECPVVIVPESFEFPESVVLTYDGSAASVHAIKQFTYLFPDWKKKRAMLVFASESDRDDQIPHQEAMEEWGARHFEDLSIMRLGINPAKYFTTWIENERSVLLVAGAMGRSGISQLFHKSFITELLKDQLGHQFFNEALHGNRLPIFIAHSHAG